MWEIDVTESLSPHHFLKWKEGKERVVFHSVVKLTETDIILLMSAPLK